MYRVKELREERNMTQSELEQKSGVSRATICALESGNVKVTTTKTLLKLANALNVTVNQLFSAQSV